MLAQVKSFKFVPARIRRRVLKRNHINELPVELLVKIFLCCLPTRTFPKPSRREAPLLLARVCCIWRSVSLNTSQLWSQITLEGLQSVSHRRRTPWTSESFHRFGIHEWLRRSGSSPLSFEIGRHFHIHTTTAPLLTLALQAEAHRWKAVILNDTCACITHILQMLWVPGKTLMLTDIHFADIELSAYPLTITPNQAFPPASQLCSICAYSENVRLLLGSGKLHALRELRIGFFEESSSPPLVTSLSFTQFPLLEILELSFRSPPFPQYDAATVTVVHSLQHLQNFFFVDRVGEYLWLIDTFNTPILNALAITSPKLGEDEGTHLSDFLLRCGGQLRRLMFHGAGGGVPWGGLTRFIQHTPMLETLCAGSPYLRRGDLMPPCPTLSQVDILFGPYDDIMMITVLAILSQWKCSGRLRERDPGSTVSPSVIRVHWDYLSHVLKHREVKKCIPLGLRVEPLPPQKESWWEHRLYAYLVVTN
ncbi:hypothetical protein BD410DRAFT_789388 [Rickenella mellea]|uniref:Uncharacterized protein n=1 Tax=Rickenella mellea TaxID=50990 RepID=A0A4Y7Q498_9AGAM|nr:hypothetical protein BD410DRAFT_789388 [Rickenella mellea]